MDKKNFFDYFGGETAGSPEGQGEAGSSPVKAETAPRGARLSERIPIGMSVKVQSKDGAEEYATTRNVSNRGLCFKTSKPYKRDEEVMVELYVGPNRHVGPLPGRIVWSVPSDGAWEQGVNWSKRLNLGIATDAPAPDRK